MKRIILCLSLFAFFGSQAQQINPVPDYVFSNKMSVGRNAVTDTAAYFSIGPRYGAIRGMMPPMVTDTANMSATKRNGLLIFSIQKNKYLYWDSVGSKWAEMAGTGGTAISSGDTASMLSPYIRAAGNGLTKSGQSLLVDTASIATRARVQKAVDSINTNVALKVNISDTASMLTPYTRGSGTTNFLPKFTGSRTFGNSVAFDNGGTELLVNTTGDSGTYALQVNGKVFSNSAFYLSANTKWELTASETARLELINRNINQRLAVFDSSKYIAFGNLANSQGGNAALYVNGSANEVYVNSANDIGNYALQVTGSIYNTTGAVLAASSGNVGIGTTSPSAKLDVRKNSFTPRSTNGALLIEDQGSHNPGIEFYVQNAGLFAGGRPSGNMGASNDYRVVIAGGGIVNGNFTSGVNNFLPSFTSGAAMDIGINGIRFYADASLTDNVQMDMASKEKMRIKTDGELLINTTTDAGAYALQVAGSIYNTTGAVLAASSGNVGIGTASPSFKLDVVGNTQISGNVQFGLSSSSNSRLYIFNSTNDNRGEIYFDGTNNRFAISSTYGGSGSFQALDLMTSEQTRVRVKSDGEVLIGTTSDAGAYVLQVSGAIYNTTTITTGAPTSGSAKPWRLGEAATVSPTSPNRTIRVEIDGTVYYIHAKTTND